MTDPFDDPEFWARLRKQGITHRPGMAASILQEMTPVLAAEGSISTT
jgi:hypothetical protein